MDRRRLEDHLFEEIAPLLEINSAPGKLINIDTLDGAGNSTQADRLAQHILKERKLDVFLTAEPTDGVLGEKIHEVLRGEWSLSAVPLQQLFSADRGEHLARLIMPPLRLREGAWVITARYALSTLAYGMASGVPAWELLAMQIHYPWPNLTIVLVVPVEECLRRIAEREKKRELFEHRDYLEKVLEAYHYLAGKLPAVELLSGEGTEEEVAVRVNRKVDEWFPVA